MNISMRLILIIGFGIGKGIGKLIGFIIASLFNQAREINYRQEQKIKEKNQRALVAAADEKRRAAEAEMALSPEELAYNPIADARIARMRYDLPR